MGLQPALVAALEARTEGGRPDCRLAALSVRTHAGAADVLGEVTGFVEAFWNASVRPRLPRRGGSGSPAGRGTHVPARHLRARPADRRLMRRVTGRSDGQRCWRLSNGRTCSSSHSTTSAGGTATTSFSLTHCVPVLSVRHGDRVNALHAAASQWLAENGLLADAVRHAIASGDYEHAADLVELAEADLRRRRHDRTLRDWLVALPHDVTSPPAARHVHGVEPALRGRHRRGGGVAQRRRCRSSPGRRQRSPRRPHSPRRPETENRRSGLSRP